MQSFLYRLFHGNYHPGERDLTTDPYYRKALEQIRQCEHLLRQEISPELASALSAYIDAHNMLVNVSNPVFFADGFALGLMCGLECAGLSENAGREKYDIIT